MKESNNTLISLYLDDYDLCEIEEIFHIELPTHIVRAIIYSTDDILKEAYSV